MTIEAYPTNCFDVIPGPMPDTLEWHEERKRHLSASDAAAICGLSPWRQPLDIYLEKRDLAPPREETAAMRLGKRLEPVVLAEYETITGHVLERPCPLFISPYHEFIAATPDALDTAAINPCNPVPVEAKTATWRRAHEFGEEGSDDIPADYVMQTQAQMFVLGALECRVPVLVDGRTLRIYRVKRHDELIAHFIVAAKELWERIQNGDPPEPNWTHPRTPELVKSLYGVDDGRVTLLHNDALQDWNAYRDLGQEIKELETRREAYKARVLYAMGDAAIGVLPDANYELVRQTQNRREYTVKACSFTTLRERKAKSA